MTNATGTSFTFTAPDADVYTVTFTVQTASGQAQSASTQVTATSVPPTATPPADVTIPEGTNVTLTFADPFSPASAVTAAGFRYSFALSSGQLASTYNAASTSPSVIFIGADIGTFTVYGRIIDKNNAYSDYPSGGGFERANRSEPAPARSRPPRARRPGRSPWPRSPTRADRRCCRAYAATIDWGDGTTSAGTIGAAVSGVFSVTGTHTYATQGHFPVRVTLTHDSLPPVTVTDAVTVVAPALVGTGGMNLSATKAADTGPITVATFTDPTGPDDPPPTPQRSTGATAQPAMARSAESVRRSPSRATTCTQQREPRRSPSP